MLKCEYNYWKSNQYHVANEPIMSIYHIICIHAALWSVVTWTEFQQYVYGVDSVYINNSGGRRLLEYFIEKISDSENYIFLIDVRLPIDSSDSLKNNF